MALEFSLQQQKRKKQNLRRILWLSLVVREHECYDTVGAALVSHMGTLPSIDFIWEKMLFNMKVISVKLSLLSSLFYFLLNIPCIRIFTVFLKIKLKMKPFFFF